ncbi:unnamed protein product [marine sediment metagenome]|uniref:Uncharacterized protein n=1 Tax=marine sediment metagenome TaxID=412755 RepID=X1V6S2_9ZZZZ
MFLLAEYISTTSSFRKPTAEIEQRMEQVQKNLHTNETRLNDLRVNRGKLSIENATENSHIIDRLDKQIESCRKDISNAPVELSILEENLKASQQQTAAKQMEQLLSQQKSCAGSMEAISKKLVKALEISHDLNIQLTTATTRYVALQKQTNVDVLMKPTCRPSEQLLQVVYETLKAELEGSKPQTARCPGQPPYVRI